MSVVTDQVRRLDAQLDRIPLLAGSRSEDGDEVSPAAIGGTYDAFSSPRVKELLRIVKALSTTSSSAAVLAAPRIRLLLSQSAIGSNDAAGAENVNVKDQYETEIEWLVVSKAAIQTYGLVLRTLLDQIVPLNEDIWYWDEVLGSYTHSSIYAVQTCPIQLWEAGRDIYHASRERIRLLDQSPSEFVETTSAGLVAQWRRFYQVVHNSIQERSVINIQNKMLSPVAKSRARARQKLTGLKRLRQMTASALGMLTSEGLKFSVDDGDIKKTQDWKTVVERSVGLMDMLLKDAGNLDSTVRDFEEKVFAGIQDDPELSAYMEVKSKRPALLARRLMDILDTGLPAHISETRNSVAGYGKPSRLVRYWLPVSIGLLSSSTIFRFLFNRRADIITWIADFGGTIRDFWVNWVVIPVRKIVGTIRHDANSEIALMSRDSLRADRESLERMVVDFAIEKPQYVPASSTLTEAQIVEIRTKVAEGDVTPVLRAFEKELKTPLSGVVRGDLLRSVLIQVQKTKVDIEVAISGIDALLKSQELVFGFVGLTPGILFSWAGFRYLQNMLAPGTRSAQKASHRAGMSVRVLRNIDRILTEATPQPNTNLLGYRDVGLLLCEVHVLRGLVRGGRLMPHDVERELLEDLDDLSSSKGIDIQTRALERIRWAYARWLR